VAKREAGDKCTDPGTEIPKTRAGKMAVEEDQNGNEDR
jgi:hypothetical protein